MIYKSSSITCKHHLLSHLLLNTLEITLVRIANRSHQYYIGAYHALQTLHLSYLGDTSLDDCYLLVTLNHQ